MWGFFDDASRYSVLIKIISHQYCSQGGMEKNCKEFFLWQVFCFPEDSTLWFKRNCVVSGPGPLEKRQRIIKITSQTYNHFRATSERNYRIESNIMITNRYKRSLNVHELVKNTFPLRHRCSREHYCKISANLHWTIQCHQVFIRCELHSEQIAWRNRYRDFMF